MTVFSAIGISYISMGNNNKSGLWIQVRSQVGGCIGGDHEVT